MAKNFELFITLSRGRLPSRADIKLNTCLARLPYILSRRRVNRSLVFGSPTKPALELMAIDLFVLLDGMLFTDIQLDDFSGKPARFLERLEMEGVGVEEREWVMMDIINLGAVLEYGRASPVVRRAGGFGRVKGETNLGSIGV